MSISEKYFRPGGVLVCCPGYVWNRIENRCLNWWVFFHLLSITITECITCFNRNYILFLTRLVLTMLILNIHKRVIVIYVQWISPYGALYYRTFKRFFLHMNTMIKQYHSGNWMLIKRSWKVTEWHNHAIQSAFSNM